MGGTGKNCTDTTTSRKGRDRRKRSGGWGLGGMTIEIMTRTIVASETRATGAGMWKIEDGGNEGVEKRKSQPRPCASISN